MSDPNSRWSCDEADRDNCRNPRGCHCREIETLRFQVELLRTGANGVKKLRERIAELEELLGLRERLDMILIADGHHRRRTEAVIRLLAKRDLVSSCAIELAFGVDHLAPKSIPVYVYFARKALRPHGITVKRDRGRGWYLPAHDKAKLRALMCGDANGAAA